MTQLTVCVASSFPGSLNRNLGIVAQLAAGFEAVLGRENVYSVSFESIADQVSHIRPHLVVLVGSALLAVCDYRPLARAASKVGCRFAFWTVEDPYELDYNWRFTDYADVVFTNDQWALEFYDRPNVFHLPTAASVDQHRSLEGYQDRSLDVFFCGVGFRNRQRFIMDAMPVLKQHRSLIMGDNWPTTASQVIVNRRVAPDTLVDYYSSSRVVLNLGRDYFLANSFRNLQPTTPGPRTFEAAMAGCVQMYFQPSYLLNTCFEPEVEIVTFNSIDEFEAKLSVLLADPRQAMAVASRAQQRCMRDHTYEVRARCILEKSDVGYANLPQEPAGTSIEP